jgi:hypothetical protein
MTQRGTWTTRGFDAFREGTFDNAGQDLYVSRAGVLQRLHQLDLNGDGKADLLVCNSQNHWESPPCYGYTWPLQAAERLEIPSAGSISGAVADLNGDGYDDLVLAMDYNGSRTDLNAFVYYGGPEGLGEHRKTELPAPQARSVVCGDFNGDGKPDLAIVCAGKLRVFYQTPLGFEPLRFADLDLPLAQLAAADLDGDGYDDLYAFGADGQALILWGGAEGLAADRVTEVRAARVAPAEAAEEDLTPEAEAVQPVGALPRVMSLGGKPHLFLPELKRFLLVPVAPDRTLGEPLAYPCAGAIAVAMGDATGDGHDDLAVASREARPEGERSWLVPGTAGGFDWDTALALPSAGACDVAIGDLDGDGRAEIVLCQDRTPDSFTHHSLVYRLQPDGAVAEIARLESHDARRVFIARPSPHPLPQVLIVNHRARRSGGDVDPVIYFYDDGFSADNCRRSRAGTAWMPSRWTWTTMAWRRS